MMKDPEKINMEINIGGERITLDVPFQKQNLSRDIESEINNLYSKWRSSFPKKTDKQLLAMLVYQYASYYKELTLRYQEAHKKALECLESIQDIKV